MGLIHSRGESKVRDLILLIVWKSLFKYDNSETFDDADLSDVIFDEQSYISIVNDFNCLSSFIRRGFTDDREVDARILKAENAFGSQYVICLRVIHFTYFIIQYRILVFDQTASPKNFAVFIIDVFKLCVMSIECKLVYFE